MIFFHYLKPTKESIFTWFDSFEEFELFYYLKWQS